MSSGYDKEEDGVMSVQDRPPPGKYKLTVADFLMLDETGVFGTTRTELLDGDIIIMNSEYRPHARIAEEVRYLMRRRLEELGSDLRPLSASTALSEHDVPLPDVVLTREARGEGTIPLASVQLVVEVSSTTLHRDTGLKATMYARAGVPEYWVVDVSGQVVRQFWSPQGDRYLVSAEATFGADIVATTIPGLTISTSAF
ncbi:Uma2 family endonuclease [Sphingomonas bacterium]|uniref:Uma2 family endonuclease n=1 Tax=Sphingomonas bacterium TaxID=1895847 RepID=UPI001574F62D|nr:Uma2 family endonuclease [Sphingomonas bacterium]